MACMSLQISYSQMKNRCSGAYSTDEEHLVRNRWDETNEEPQTKSTEEDGFSALIWRFCIAVSGNSIAVFAIGFEIHHSDDHQSTVYTDRASAYQNKVLMVWRRSSQGRLTLLHKAILISHHLESLFLKVLMVTRLERVNRMVIYPPATALPQ
ncbi:hypothetical protein LOTGIDRAFT_169530 [Lottia gigantea]|uniref:Uncharacterized protein n=1 Tax=Lottia gigantea TaxID=225164 RepID=V3ZQY2_LOTGI|nr:hypothetical protein LOTGIDRAFT_169530 [Lottia gigantea]ESO83306.1 hypothetical protein LOTGIDRAFT_169530 [Lottia gigantea]